TEFRRLERRRGRSGKDTIDHPPRGSDDIANAVAGVTWVTLEQAGQSVMPEAYGERICRDFNFYLEGLSTGAARYRYCSYSRHTKEERGYEHECVENTGSRHRALEDRGSI